MWLVIAFMRAYHHTGEMRFLSVAKANFDLTFERAYSEDLGGGLFWLFNSFTVDSGLGGFGGGYFNVFGMRMTGGVMLIPLMLGIGLIFFLDGKKRFIGYFTAALGLLVIVIALISSLSFHAKYGNTLYVYVIMFAMIAAGAGLLIKSTFKKKN